MLELLYADSHFFPVPHRYSGQNFGVFPLEQVREFGSIGLQRENRTSLLNVKLISKNSNLYLNVTDWQKDEQTDGQTICPCNTALCVTSRGKNEPLATGYSKLCAVRAALSLTRLSNTVSRT